MKHFFRTDDLFIMYLVNLAVGVSDTYVGFHGVQVHLKVVRHLDELRPLWRYDNQQLAFTLRVRLELLPGILEIQTLSWTHQ